MATARHSNAIDEWRILESSKRVSASTAPTTPVELSMPIDPMDSNVIELRRLQRQLYRRRVWLSQIGCGVLLSPFLGVAVLIFALRPTPWDGPIEAIYGEWPYDSASGMRIVLDIRKDGSYLQTVYSPEPDDTTRQYSSLWYYDRKENELSFIDYHIVGPGNTDPQVWYVGKRNNEPYLSGDDRSDRDNFKRIFRTKQ